MPSNLATANARRATIWKPPWKTSRQLPIRNNHVRIVPAPPTRRDAVQRMVTADEFDRGNRGLMKIKAHLQRARRALDADAKAGSVWRAGQADTLRNCLLPQPPANAGRINATPVKISSRVGNRATVFNLAAMTPPNRALGRHSMSKRDRRAVTI